MRNCIGGCKIPAVHSLPGVSGVPAGSGQSQDFSKKYAEVLELFGKIGYYKGKQVCANFNKLNFN